MFKVLHFFLQRKEKLEFHCAERDIDGYATYVVGKPVQCPFRLSSLILLLAHLCNNIGALLFNRTLKDLRDDPLDHSRFNHYVGQESPRLGGDQSIQGTHSTTDHQTFHSIVDALGKVQVVLTSHLSTFTHLDSFIDTKPLQIESPHLSHIFSRSMREGAPSIVYREISTIFKSRSITTLTTTSRHRCVTT